MDSDSARKKKGQACPHCGNRLRVRPDQIGTQVMCPKCETTFTVARPGSQATVAAVTQETSSRDRPPPDILLQDILPQETVPQEIVPQAAASPIVNDDDAYEPEIPLVRSSAVPEEQMVDLSPAANRQSGYEVDWDQSDAIEVEDAHERPTHDETEYLALAEARGLLRNEVTVDPPELTFFSGVFSFPWRGPNITRWGTIAFGMVVSGEFLVASVGVLSGGVGTGTLAGPLVAMITSVLLLLTGAFAAPSFLAAVQDTADGFDEVQESTMPDWDQWFFSLFSVVSVALLSGAVGFPLTLVPEIGPAAIPVFMLVLFPILILSAMECESFVLPFSPPILGSLLRNAGAWLMFYLVSTALLATWFVVMSFSVRAAPYLMVLLLAPALAAVVLIYARLLGRLGWCITGSPLGRTVVSPNATPGVAKGRAKKGGRRRKRVVPEDLDAAAEMLAERGSGGGLPRGERRR